MEKRKEILDEEHLNEVSGGGSGPIPEGGVTYSRYDTPEAGYLYCSSAGGSYCYLFGVNNDTKEVSYTREKTSIYSYEWYSYNDGGTVTDTFDNFKSFYCLKTNLRP